MHRILIDKYLCKGCKSCVLACMMRSSNAENMYTLNLNNIDTESKNHIEMDKIINQYLYFVDIVMNQNV